MVEVQGFRGVFIAEVQGLRAFMAEV